jgi:two-component system response regulator VanR
MRQEAKEHLNEAEIVQNKRKVLVFDQDIVGLARHSETFEVNGFAVHQCLSVEKAMRCVEREQVDFALIDLSSPAHDGLRVFRHLVRYNLFVPSVVITRSGDRVARREAFTIGAVECLEKPVSRADLDWAIQKYLGGPVKHHGR